MVDTSATNRTGCDDLPSEVLEKLSSATYTGLTDDEDSNVVCPSPRTCRGSTRMACAAAPAVSTRSSLLGAVTRSRKNSSFYPHKRTIITRPESLDSLLSNTKLDAMHQAASSRPRNLFLNVLPSELRVMIYRLLLVSRERISFRRFEVIDGVVSNRVTQIHVCATQPSSYADNVQAALSLAIQTLLVCRTVYLEAVEVLWGENVFFSNDRIMDKYVSDSLSYAEAESMAESSHIRYPSISWRLRNVELDLLVVSQKRDINYAEKFFLDESDHMFTSRLCRENVRIPQITIRCTDTPQGMQFGSHLDRLDDWLVFYGYALVQADNILLRCDGSGESAFENLLEALELMSVFAAKGSTTRMIELSREGHILREHVWSAPFSCW